MLGDIHFCRLTFPAGEYSVVSYLCIKTKTRIDHTNGSELASYAIVAADIAYSLSRSMTQCCGREFDDVLKTFSIPVSPTTFSGGAALDPRGPAGSLAIAQLGTFSVFVLLSRSRCANMSCFAHYYLLPPGALQFTPICLHSWH